MHIQLSCCFEMGLGDLNEVWQSYTDINKFPLFWLSHEMNPCYEGLKEIRADVDERWRKTVRFSVCLWLFIWTVILLDPLLFLLDRSSCVFLGYSIGLLPLILIVLWNETLLWRFERNRSWCQWDMKENVVF